MEREEMPVDFDAYVQSMSLSAKDQASPNEPRTLSFDVGGTGIKASVLDWHGLMLHERSRLDTPYPLTPELLVEIMGKMDVDLPPFDRISVGFPGMVRDGKILSAPHFVSPTGPGGKVSDELLEKWIGHDLSSAIANRLGKPTKVANDADVQGAAVVQGDGLELVVTLGTGVGTALFYNGRLCPHLELAHHPFHKGFTYNEVLGEQARKETGHKEWNQHVELMITVLRQLTFFDHCFIGGGNSAHVKLDLPSDVSLTDNSAGILGGIKLWERS